MGVTGGAPALRPTRDSGTWMDFERPDVPREHISAIARHAVARVAREGVDWIRDMTGAEVRAAWQPTPVEIDATLLPRLAERISPSEARRRLATLAADVERAKALDPRGDDED